MGSVTYLATRECLDLISGKVSDMVTVAEGGVAAAEIDLVGPLSSSLSLYRSEQLCSSAATITMVVFQLLVSSLAM